MLASVRRVRRDEGFGERLRTEMRRAGISPSELAERMGVGPGTVSRWRKGELPGDLRLQLLAGTLRIAPGWLKTGQGEREAPIRAGGQDAPWVRRADADFVAAAHEAVRDYRENYKGKGVWPPEAKLIAWIMALADAEPSPPGGGAGGADRAAPSSPSPARPAGQG